jgi:hypothetical protein
MESDLSCDKLPQNPNAPSSQNHLHDCFKYAIFSNIQDKKSLSRFGQSSKHKMFKLPFKKLTPLSKFYTEVA